MAEGDGSVTLHGKLVHTPVRGTRRDLSQYARRREGDGWGRVQFYDTVSVRVHERRLGYAIAREQRKQERGNLQP